MKKQSQGSFLLLTILMIISLTPLSKTITAHTPNNMELSYDPHSSVLMVNITHPVEDNSTHYISGVKICLRELVFKEYNYTSQPNNETFQYYYKLEANSGDKIKVGAYCNTGGEIHEQILAGGRYKKLEIPGFELLWLMIPSSVILVMVVVYRKID